MNQNVLQDSILTVLGELVRVSNSTGQAFDTAQIPCEVAHAINEAYASFPSMEPG